MQNEKKQTAADFLGVKVLTPLEEKAVIGGIEEGSHHDTDEGRHHSHHHTPAIAEAAE